MSIMVSLIELVVTDRPMFLNIFVYSYLTNSDTYFFPTANHKKIRL